MAARKGHRPSKAPAGRPRFWGKHAVGAALANPERTVRKIMGENWVNVLADVWGE